ncbi:chemotaxis protein CheX [Aquibacillus halophilus]|uniref:Chemotaxis protein CheX n=1 Tax=Aquibacillus halophilus TaxID=930132 RepID=A0A6A8D9Z5_9BACI|nr:chemotaxis protein CheX [Aquibacillus halophilus]MRH42110.1 chemotaxis protein CheX [Aquibacillus halophilus]
MSAQLENKNHVVKELYNGTIQSLKTIIPIQHVIGKPSVINNSVSIEFGVLIGFTGNLKGELIIKGDTTLFSSVGKEMYGMPLEGEMLSSFSGELGNMIAGSIATNIAEKGIETDITYPTVLSGNTKLSGFKKALLVTVTYADIGDMEVYFLFNS